MTVGLEWLPKYIGGEWGVHTDLKTDGEDAMKQW